MGRKKMNLETIFSVNLLADTVAVPKMLLTHYQQLGLSEKELVVLLKVYAVGVEEGLALSEFANECCVIPGLIKKKFVAIKQVDKIEYLCLNWCILFERLLELWVYQQSTGCDKKITCGEELLKPVLTEPGKQEEVGKCDFGTLYQYFEKEFGRGLSPLETEKIVEWQENLGFRDDVILEALKRAVYRGKYSFAYIDTILHDWFKKNIRTVCEIERLDMDRNDHNHEQGKTNKKVKAKEKECNRTDYSLIYQKK